MPAPGLVHHLIYNIEVFFKGVSQIVYIAVANNYVIYNCFIDVKIKLYKHIVLMYLAALHGVSIRGELYKSYTYHGTKL